MLQGQRRPGGAQRAGGAGLLPGLGRPHRGGLRGAALAAWPVKQHALPRSVPGRCQRAQPWLAQGPAAAWYVERARCWCSACAAGLALPLCLRPDSCPFPAATLGAQQRLVPAAQVVESVVGRSCRLGAGCHLTGAYLHDDVTLGDDVHVSHALLCQGAVVRDRATVLPGAVVSFKARCPGCLAS